MFLFKYLVINASAKGSINMKDDSGAIMLGLNIGGQVEGRLGKELDYKGDPKSFL